MRVFPRNAAGAPARFGHDLGFRPGVVRLWLDVDRRCFSRRVVRDGAVWGVIEPFGGPAICAAGGWKGACNDLPIDRALSAGFGVCRAPRVAAQTFEPEQRLERGCAVERSAERERRHALVGAGEEASFGPA